MPYSSLMEPIRQEDGDEALMERVAEGDRRAFQALVERYAGRAHAVAQRLLHSRADAQDAVQDACVKLWVHAASWNEDKARFSTWFYRILTNTCIDAQRRRRPSRPLEDGLEIADPGWSAEEALAAGQRAALVKKAVAALPPRQQVALTLCYYEQMSNGQAAEVMGIHIKALEGLLVRARRALRADLAGTAV